MRFLSKWDVSYEQTKVRVEWFAKEGEEFEPGPTGRKEMAKITGPARLILLGERPALNMLARAAGVATISRKLKKLKEEKKWNGIMAATRKTTPGFRIVEKYACLVGGMIYLKQEWILTAWIFQV
jgi:nicotinate-nucleotide pyrophosphorylase (carboxylating)